MNHIKSFCVKNLHWPPTAFRIKPAHTACVLIPFTPPKAHKAQHNLALTHLLSLPATLLRIVYHTPAYGKLFPPLSGFCSNCSFSRKLSLFSPPTFLVSFLFSAFMRPSLGPLGEPPYLAKLPLLLTAVKTWSLESSLIHPSSLLYSECPMNPVDYSLNLFLLFVLSYSVVQKDITRWPGRIDKIRKDRDGPCRWASTWAEIRSKNKPDILPGNEEKPIFFLFWIYLYLFFIFITIHFRAVVLNFLRSLLTLLNIW